MRKFLFSLLTALAIMLPMSMQAQSPVTVADGTATNEYVPFYGYWMDEDQHNQVLYPDSMLTALRGQTLSKIQFYCSSNLSWSHSITVKIGVVTDSVLTGLHSTAGLTTVSNGNLSFTGSVCEISFDQYYTYPAEGGHLLVDIESEGGAYTITSFLGVSTSTNQSRYSYSSSGSNQRFLPKTTFSIAGGCLAKPADVAVFADSSSARISWSYNADAASYVIVMNNQEYTTTDTTYTLTGLTPSTTYSCDIMGICGTGDTSEVRPLTFTTSCGAPAFPLMITFEQDNQALLNCWAVTESYSSWYSWPMLTTVSHNGTYAIEFMDVNSLASPLTYVPTNTLEVLFYGKADTYASASEAILVGYSTSISDMSENFVAVDTIYLTSDWQQYTVSFASTTADTGYVVFRHVTEDECYIDDITLRQIRTCADPAQFAMDSTSTGSISFSWVDSVAAQWEICYGPQGFNPDTLQDVQVTDLSETSATVTELQDSITYDFYLRANCGSEQSYWVGPITARPNLYLLAANATDTLRACGITITDDGGITGNYAYTQNSTLVVYPSDEGMAATLSGTVALYTYNYGTFAIYEGVGTAGRQLCSFNTGVHDVNVASTSGPLTIVLNVHGYGDSYSNEGFVLYLNCVPLSSCTDPYDVAISSVVGNSATISWNYGTTTTPESFEITAYNLTDTTEAPLLFTAQADDRTFIMSGFEQQTRYRASVKAVCGAGDESNEIFASPFKTKCIVGTESLVGDTAANTSTSTAAVFHTNYRYGLSQTLYTAASLAQISDTVYGIKFKNNGSLDYEFTLDVYAQTTSDTVLSAYQPQPAANHVFHGTVNTRDGWIEIPFDQTIVLDDTLGLLITIDNNTGDYTSSSTWMLNPDITGCNFGVYSDATNFDPTSSSYNFTAYARPVAIFLGPCADASCVAPNANFASATSTSATINWVAGNIETSWKVEYRLLGDTTWTLSEATTAANTYTVTGLTPATQYQFRITSLCGADDEASTIVAGNTACAPVVDFPFTESFENYFDLCWHNGSNYSGSSSYPYVSSGYAHTGSHSMYLYAYSYSSYYSYVTLPEMGVNVDTLLVRFAMRGIYNSYGAVVGVLTDPANINSLTVIDTVTYTGNGTNWDIKEVDLSSYAGSGRYICIKALASGSSWYLDDIEVVFNNPCRRPENAAVAALTTTSATLTWADTLNTGSYTIYWGTSDSVQNATDSATVSATSHTITGLATGTVYYAWVRSNCTACPSFWVPFGSFRTNCEKYVVTTTNEYFDDFENGFGACYDQDYISGTHNWTVTTTTSNPAAAQSGNYVMAFNHVTSGDETMLILPTFDFSQLTLGASLSYYHTQVAWGTQDELHVYYRTSDTAAWTAIADYTDDIAAWTYEEHSLPASAGADFYQVAFKGVDRWGRGVKLDDITVFAAPTCFRPDTLTAEVQATSALLSWNGNASDFELMWKAASDNAWNTQAVSGHSYSLTGLTGSTRYNFKVRGICSATDTSRWSDVATFLTAICDNVEFTDLYDLTDTTATYVLAGMPVDNYYHYTITEFIIDSAELASANALDGISFYYYDNNPSTDKDSVRIYLQPTSKSSFADASDYENLDPTTGVEVYNGPFNCTYGWNDFGFPTQYSWNGQGNLLVIVVDSSDDYAGSSNTMRFLNGYVADSTRNVSWRYRNDSQMYGPEDLADAANNYGTSVFNYRPVVRLISCGSSCAAPVLQDVANITFDGATISWAGSGTEFEVAVTEFDNAAWPAETTVQGNTYTFTGLQPNTTYAYRVRQNCDTLGSSSWREGTFTTDSLPCFAVEGLQATATTVNSVTLTWTNNAQSNATAWVVNVFNSTQSIFDTVSATTATIAGLFDNTQYYVSVQSRCAASVYSDWSDTISFTTSSCEPVSGVSVSNITATGATVSWNAGGASAWQVNYGEMDFPQGGGQIVDVTSATYAITGLNANEEYDVYVRVKCAEGIYSEWSAKQSFTTLNNGGENGIDDINANYTLSIYPNPASGNTTISLSGVEGEVTISVVDMNGRTISTDIVNCGADCVKTINVEHLAQGTYFVRVLADGINSVRKLIVR